MSVFYNSLPTHIFDYLIRYYIDCKIFDCISQLYTGCGNQCQAMSYVILFSQSSFVKALVAG